MKHGANAGRPPTHGRYSRLRDAFGEAWDSYVFDPDLWRFESDVALYLAREAELTKRLDQGDSPEWREEALALFNQMQGASEKELPALVKALHRHLKDGASRDQAWEALQKNAERRAQIAEKAVNAMTKAENALTARGLVVWLGRMLDIIRDEMGEANAGRCSRRFRTEIIGRLGSGGESPTVDGPTTLGTASDDSE